MVMRHHRAIPDYSPDCLRTAADYSSVIQSLLRVEILNEISRGILGGQEISGCPRGCISSTLPALTTGGKHGFVFVDHDFG